MAVSKTKMGYKFAAAGDVTTDRVIIHALVIDSPTVAGSFTFKDGNGNVIIDDVELAQNETKCIQNPCGGKLLNGFEMDACPTDGVVYLIVK
jgi:hypothetical protein